MATIFQRSTKKKGIDRSLRKRVGVTNLVLASKAK